MAEGEKKKSIDPASIELINKACSDEISLAFDRAEALKPCPIGAVGSCCSNCGMGPCRVPLPKGKI
jgi:carbon-monoxide dehydrogenase catalytic subunit